MRVSGVNSAPCLECYYCKRGQYQLCEHLFEDGMGFLGTYAEYIRIPARLARINVWEIPDGVPYEYAAITEPLACILNGVEESNIQIGDTVVFIGCGTIGLLGIQLARLRGAQTVIAMDIKDERLSIARTLGADITINPVSYTHLTLPTN